MLTFIFVLLCGFVGLMATVIGLLLATLLILRLDEFMDAPVGFMLGVVSTIVRGGDDAYI